MSSRSIRSCILFAAAILFLIAPLAPAFADPDLDDSQSTNEYQTKAAFLFNFAKFVDWPAHKFSQPDSPLIIGVVGTDPFGGLLEEAAQDQHVNDHTVIIRHVESNQELRKCHILFVCRSEASRLGQILWQVHGDNVLTVGDTERFISRGGMINFVMLGNTVRFQIDDAQARHAGLKIRSQLLALPLRLPLSR